jgi:hypothetical protein
MHSQNSGKQFHCSRPPKLHEEAPGPCGIHRCRFPTTSWGRRDDWFANSRWRRRPDSLPRSHNPLPDRWRIPPTPHGGSGGPYREQGSPSGAAARSPRADFGGQPGPIRTSLKRDLADGPHKPAPVGGFGACEVRLTVGARRSALL